MQHDITLQPRHVVIEEPTVLDDAARDLALAGCERRKRNALAPAHLVENRKVRRCQDAEVLAILAVDALDAFRDNQFDAGAHLGVGRLLAG